MLWSSITAIITLWTNTFTNKPLGGWGGQIFTRLTDRVKMTPA
jgi:hypothetical protein